jgi:lipopolysaccharide export system protein LptA
MRLAFSLNTYNPSKFRAFMKFNLLKLFLTFTVALAVQAACAEKADRNKPMNIEADALKHDEQQQLTIFTGKVSMTKGSLVLKAARIEVKQDAKGQQVANLWAQPGERIFFRQKREGLDEYTEGEAETAVYDSQANTLTLTTRAELRLLRGAVVADRIQGQQIVVNNSTEVFTVDGKVSSAANTSPQSGQRVKATFTPRPSTTDANPPVSAPSLKSSAKLGGNGP